MTSIDWFNSCDTRFSTMVEFIKLLNRATRISGRHAYEAISRHDASLVFVDVVVFVKLEGMKAVRAAATLYPRDRGESRSLIKDFLDNLVVAEPGNPLNLDKSPAWVQVGKEGVGLLCFAFNNTLFLAIIDPHRGAKPPAEFAYVRKLNLIAGANDDTEVAFSVYAIPYTDSPANRAHVVTIAVTFAVSALHQHTLEDATSLTAHQLLVSHHFLFEHRIPMGEKKDAQQQICIAASSDDFGVLWRRFVDCRGDGHLLCSARLVDFADAGTWSDDPGVVVLIGGESGSGKTCAMLTNFYQLTDLTVYIRLGHIPHAAWQQLGSPDTR
ncbi:Hypothetical protein, putative, partial [Bodo saltans]